jgi:hypothetical protein
MPRSSKRPEQDAYIRPTLFLVISAPGKPDNGLGCIVLRDACCAGCRSPRPAASDDLSTSAELLREQLVRLSDVIVPATRVTAEEFFSIALDDLGAARGIRVPLDASG